MRGTIADCSTGRRSGDRPGRGISFAGPHLPGRASDGAPCPREGTGSAGAGSGPLIAEADLVGVHGVFGHLPPQILLGPERLDVVVELLEPLVLGRDFGVKLLSGLVAAVHDIRREWLQHRALRDELLQRDGIHRVVLRRHPRAAVVGGRLQHLLVDLRQLVPLGEVEEVVRGRARLPPARIVVVAGDLDEAELLVVVRADPFGGVDGALLERGIDVAACDLLRDDAELRQDHAGEAADAELETLEVLERVDLLAEPAAHLAVRRARDEARAVVLGAQELIDELLAAAVHVPRVLHARVHAEGQIGAEGERGILAEVVVEWGVAALDRAGLDGIEHLQAGDDFAGCERGDLELVVGEFRHALGEVFRLAVQRVERFRPARRHAPLDLGHGLRDRRCGERYGRCGADAARTRGLQESAPVQLAHSVLPKRFCRPLCAALERVCLHTAGRSRTPASWAD